jgi:hypothetical protein
MKNRAIGLAVAAAALASMMPTSSVSPANARVIQASNPGQAGSAGIVSPAPSTAAARRAFLSATGAFAWKPRKPGPNRKVAWDKRDARKARNRARSKR